MKIEIDLNDIMHHEDYGSESVQESIRRQVVENITNSFKDGFLKKIDRECAQVIESEIKQVVKDKMQDVVMRALDGEFVAVDKWGDRKSEPTTLRKQIIASIHSEMKFKKDSYQRAENVFTECVLSIVNSMVKDLKESFDMTVKEEIFKEAANHALKRFKESFK
jgi:hypothetical protein